MQFTIDNWALPLLFLLFLGVLALRLFVFTNTQVPSLAFSKINDLKIRTWRLKFLSWPLKLHLCALTLFAAAFTDPRILLPATNNTADNHTPLKPILTEGIALYLALDQSGSMEQNVQIINKEGKSVSISKINWMKEVTKQFILDHPSDLIGLVTFARIPRIEAPLTLDHQMLLNKIDQMTAIQDVAKNGTAIGYAIYKTAHLLSLTKHYAKIGKQNQNLPFTIKGSAIIVVTDGFQDPSRLDSGNRLRTIELDDAAAFVKKEGIHLYIINVDQKFSSSEFSPHRRLLEKLTDETGGKFYMIENIEKLQAVYKSIDQLEKGKVNQNSMTNALNVPGETFTRFSLYPYLIICAAICLLLALSIDSLILKQVP